MDTAIRKFIQTADTHSYISLHTIMQIASVYRCLIFSFKHFYFPIIPDFSLQLGALGLLGTRLGLA